MSFEIQEITEVPGLFYVDLDFKLTPILARLDSQKWTGFSSDPSSRLVQHYGHIYNYKTRCIEPGAPEIPKFLTYLVHVLTRTCRELKLTDESYIFNQCIVNNYNPNQCITRHTDVTGFGPVIGCFTLNSGATMIFQRNGVLHKLYTKPNSLYIMSGESRYRWTHEMTPGKFDVVEGEKIQRDRRVSVTFRNVPVKEK